MTGKPAPSRTPDLRVIATSQSGSPDGPGRDWQEIRSEFASEESDSTESLKSFMDRLRRERQRLGLTQKTVAERMDVSQSRVSAIETGDLEKAEVGTLMRYINALGARLSLIAEVGG